jgi:DNA replication licensing factor MCM4
VDSFGHQLRSSLIRQWTYHYINYDELKALLKDPYETEPTEENPAPPRRAWNSEDEEKFVRRLEAELDKVFTFQKFKTEEIIRRIMGADEAVNEVVHRDESDPMAKEEDYMLLEEDLSGIMAEVHDLAKFTQLNHTGFNKIIKKHDVRDLSTLSSPLRLTVTRNKNRSSSSLSSAPDCAPIPTSTSRMTTGW